MIANGKYGLGLEAKKDDKKTSADYHVKVSSDRVSSSVVMPKAVKFTDDEVKKIEFQIRMSMEKILGKYFK